jgi:hypothetical protein
VDARQGRQEKLGRAAQRLAPPLDGPDAQEEYINFYAYLHKVVDSHFKQAKEPHVSEMRKEIRRHLTECKRQAEMFANA